MKFDVVIGNPPYQKMTGAKITGENKSTAKSIYHRFVDVGRRLEPIHLAMIIPARWYLGGIEDMKDWSKSIINDNRMTALVDYYRPDALFGKNIPGGLCYFWWWKSEKEQDHIIDFIPEGDRTRTEKRPLNEFDVFIRDSKAIPILKKVLAKTTTFLDEPYVRRNFFNIESNLTDIRQDWGAILSEGVEKNDFDVSPPEPDDLIKLYGREWIYPILRRDIPWFSTKPRSECDDMIMSWKVVLTKTTSHNRPRDKKVYCRCDVLPPRSATTASFFIIGSFKTKQEADNFKDYLTTKFARFMFLLRSNTQHITTQRMAWVPQLDAKRRYTDAELYEKYGLTDDEIEHIEKIVKPFKDAPPIPDLVDAQIAGAKQALAFLEGEAPPE